MKIKDIFCVKHIALAKILLAQCAKHADNYLQMKNRFSMSWLVRKIVNDN